MTKTFNRPSQSVVKKASSIIYVITSGKNSALNNFETLTVRCTNEGKQNQFETTMSTYLNQQNQYSLGRKNFILVPNFRVQIKLTEKYNLFIKSSLNIRVKTPIKNSHLLANQISMNAKQITIWVKVHLAKYKVKNFAGRIFEKNRFFLRFEISNFSKSKDLAYRKIRNFKSNKKPAV